jgi:hypothetical protein
VAERSQHIPNTGARIRASTRRALPRGHTKNSLILTEVASQKWAFLAAIIEFVFLDVLRSSGYIWEASVGRPVAMPRPLTVIAIAKIKKPGRYAVGNGVYLQITGKNGRSWIFRVRAREVCGQATRRHVGLSPCALVSLAEAREKGAGVQKLLLSGMIHWITGTHSLRQRRVRPRPSV